MTPPRDGLIGPLFGWELVRLARRGHAARARGILTAVVLVSLLLFTAAWFAKQGMGALLFGTVVGPSARDTARFGEQFATAFLIAQLFAMILITPAYAAGGIAEEKDRKTFDFLLSTSLSNREIVLGKFFARVTFLLATMAAGLPILCLTFLYGGVDVLLLLASYALTAGTVAVVAAASLLAALMADGYRAAMFRAYGLTVLFAVVGFGCFYVSPLFVFVALQSLRLETGPFLMVAIGYPWIEVIIAGILLRLAVGRVRTVAKPNPNAPPRVPLARPVADNDVVEFLTPDEPSRPLPVARPVRRRELESDDDVVPMAPSLPPLRHGDDPFVWKERYSSLHGRTADEDSLVGLKISVGIMGGIGLVILAVVGALTAMAGKGGDVLVAAGTFGLVLQIVLIGSDACGRIALERSRGTLETLLTIPHERVRILIPKLGACVRKTLTWGPFASLGLVVGLFASDVAPIAWPVACYVLLLPVAAGIFGLDLSIRSPTTTRALVMYLPVAGTAALAPAAVFLAFDRGEIRVAVVVSVVLTAILAASTGLLWRALVNGFERDGGIDGGR